MMEQDSVAGEPDVCCHGDLSGYESERFCFVTGCRGWEPSEDTDI